MDRLQRVLSGLDAVPSNGARDSHEVWSLSGGDAIATRTERLVDGAVEAVVLVLGSEQLLTDKLVEYLARRIEAWVDVIVGALTEDLRQRVQEELPGAKVFVSGLEWLQDGPGDEDLAIGRLLLVDEQAILLSTFLAENGQLTQKAVFGRGFTNGIVVMARRIMATGLEEARDPGREPSTDVDA